MSLTNKIFWVIFIALLLVLLPHTAWWFEQFENLEPWILFGFFIPIGTIIAWAGAFAFEGAIAALMHKVVKINESVPNFKDKNKKFRYRFLNLPFIGLVVVTMISVVANYSHAVEFARPIKAFTQIGVPVLVYSVLGGAILPVCSLLFAGVLANVQDTEEVENEELIEANEKIKLLNAKLREANTQIDGLKKDFSKVEDGKAHIFIGSKQDRILAIHSEWPHLSGVAIAKMTDSAPSHVSSVLNSQNGKDR